MSRRPNTDARRAQIVAALLGVIARQGYEKATIQAIAREAGLAPGLIHYHFENKRAILVALVSAMAAAARERFEAVLGEARRADERLRAYLQARLGLGEGATPDAVAAWVMIGAEAVRQPEVREVYAAAVAAERALLETLLAQAMRERGRRAQEAPLLAAGLVAMIEGAFQLSSAAGEAMPRGYAAEAAIGYATRAIEAAPGA